MPAQRKIKLMLFRENNIDRNVMILCVSMDKNSLRLIKSGLDIPLVRLSRWCKINTKSMSFLHGQSKSCISTPG